ncbi:replication protein A 70 kDa DNA-binding subunit D-like [Nicotiana tabacum]|uniref:Replication protein A 70 kDa DNA-binding subunit D-like n=1 Tax=Nicotiana tabacum TaxID=4097 RepID=A0AC58UPH8_TOBAC
MQVILFTDQVNMWKEHLEQGGIYYIINGRINDRKPNFQSVHKEFEIVFSNNTIVKRCNNSFSTISFSNSFVSFEEAFQCTNGIIFDTLGILVKVNASIGDSNRKRREITLMNERCDRQTVTLWGEVAEKDGDILQNMIFEKPIVALCDVKGNFVISTTHVSSVMTNPSFEKAIALQNWHNCMKSQDKDITLMPSRLIKKARKVKIGDITHADSFDNTEDTYRKFNVKIKDIINNDDPWYLSCKKCYKKVSLVDNIATCPRCGSNVEYEERYLLKLELFDEKEHCYITLFEATKYLLGCDVTTYVRSISQKKEESKYYRKLVSSKDKEFTFLVKLDPRIGGDRPGKSLIAEELHEVGKVDAIEIADDEIKAAKTIKKTKQIEEENDASTTHKRINIERD